MNGENPWVDLQEAIVRVRRSRRTIYRWVAEGRVRTWRPMVKQLFHMGDLLKAERDTGGKGVR